MSESCRGCNRGNSREARPASDALAAQQSTQFSEMVASSTDGFRPSRKKSTEGFVETPSSYFGAERYVVTHEPDFCYPACRLRQRGEIDHIEQSGHGDTGYHWHYGER